MLSLLSRTGPNLRPLRHWKTASAAEAVALVRSGTTVAVGWLGDGLASALADAFADNRQPNDLTIVYSATQGNGRNHGLNLLAREGLVRRVIGGQWHPVPALQALAAANRVEAYSLPVGVIKRLFRDIADGLPGHLSRSGLGTVHRSPQRRRTAEPAHAGANGSCGPSSRRGGPAVPGLQHPDGTNRRGLHGGNRRHRHDA